MNRLESPLVLVLIFVLTCLSGAPVHGQSDFQETTFSEIKVMQNDGKKFRQKKAVITFRKDNVQILVKKGTDINFRYDEIVSAEYSYSKNPRWKTGLGLTAVGILFPPIWLVSIPLGFTKHRRHWLTIRSDQQFAVLKLSKSNRKLVLPTLETRARLTVKAVGEEK